MTEAMPFLQKHDITFLRPLTIRAGGFFPTRGGTAMEDSMWLDSSKMNGFP